MKDLRTFIESGLLETYVLGMSSKEESDLVEEMAAAFTEIRAELDAICETLEMFAVAHAVTPAPAVKPLLMATIDFTERMKNGEVPTNPPQLHEGSQIADYSTWLLRPDMFLPEEVEHFHAKIIGYTPQVLTAIVWIRHMAPQEVHDNEYEKFLIVEGTCDITIGAKVHSLVPGSYLSIPLHTPHHVVVTSAFPCKVILQRVAA
jgi:mannose-6-phosphate isomerase-like protein (cupin superfamily)